MLLDSGGISLGEWLKETDDIELSSILSIISLEPLPLSYCDPSKRAAI